LLGLVGIIDDGVSAQCIHIREAREYQDDEQDARDPMTPAANVIAFDPHLDVSCNQPAPL
jgi:hypothetical protein